MTIHIGFTGTRKGCTTPQLTTIRRLFEDSLGDDDVLVHQGCCVGADAEFCDIADGYERVGIVGHPPLQQGLMSDRALAYCSEINQPQSFSARNAAIVAASQIMVAAPLESTPQKRGGTWMTIGMARRALRAGKLQAMYVVGRDGELLEHTRWPAP